MKKLLVEGWRGISHSYAMVNQYELIEFKKQNIDLHFKDLPFYKESWADEKNHCGFSQQSLEELYSIQEPSLGERLDVTYRVGFPYFLYPSKSETLFVYGTSEYQRITEGMVFQGPKKLAFRDLPLKIITPSHWSKLGFLKAGFRDEQITVISHGVDQAIFKPLDSQTREQYRALLGAQNGDFIILSIGAMTSNKGIDVLLLAYFNLYHHYPNIKLVLKDQRGVHGQTAQDLVRSICAEKMIDMTSPVVAEAISRIVFIGQNLTLVQLNGLYGAADVYVSPYRAEGFNLPPLEAAASGTPIIVTKGGATDDYVDKSFASLIEATIKNDGDTTYLEPSLESLIDKITLYIESNNNELDLQNALKIISEKLTWGVVTKQLINEFDLG